MQYSSDDKLMIDILCVEDDQMIILGYEEMIKTLKPENVQIRKIYTAINGEEGFEMFLKYRPSIIVSDIRMPKLSGLDMCRMIKAEEEDAFIIITSAYGDTEYLMQSISLGVKEYITKPVNFSSLEKSLNIAFDWVSLRYEKNRIREKLHNLTSEILNIEEYNTPQSSSRKQSIFR